MRGTAVAVGLLVIAWVLPAEAGREGRAAAQMEDRVTERWYLDGRLVVERGLRTDDDAIAFERVYHHRPEAAKPDNPGKGKGGGGDGGGAPLTDCPATKYSTAGWSWREPFVAYATDYVTQFQAAAQAWDARTSAALSGGVIAGKAGDAGAFDGVNQFEFAFLGSSSTIAVTTTWYYRGTGEAVESDAQYNTYYAWSTTGEANAMDVLNIATHEYGHTFGLSHPRGSSASIGCLTMYAYASYGETEKRTLGDGDILGIQAIYGA
jgi:hypothetical protein